MNTVHIQRRPVVLMYHGFTRCPRADDPNHLFVTESALELQLQQLRRRGWISLDLDHYLRAIDGGSSPCRSFLITVDDGLRSFAEIAAPRLLRMRTPSVLFVPAQHVGGLSAWMPELATEPLVNADDLRALQSMGVEIGAHGLTHTAMVGISDEELKRHTKEARELLADMIGTPPRAFAYPYGVFDERAWRAVEKAGFTVAFAVFSDVGRYAISRVDVNAADDPRTYRIKLLPGYRQLWQIAGKMGPARRWSSRLLRRLSAAEAPLSFAAGELRPPYSSAMSSDQLEDPMGDGDHD